MKGVEDEKFLNGAISLAYSIKKRTLRFLGLKAGAWLRVHPERRFSLRLERQSFAPPNG